MRQLDVLFVEGNSTRESYQGLAEKFAAVEVPVWSLLLAGSCRAKGYGVSILDCNAENLNVEQASSRIKEINPKLVVFVVYGQNPNSGTCNMIGCYKLAQRLKQDKNYKIAFIGSHTSAVPKEVLAQKFVDFVIIGDGVYCLHNLLKTDLNSKLSEVKGLGWKIDEFQQINSPERVVAGGEEMDRELPEYAWDLVDLSKYRSHYWHSNFTDSRRTPFASLYTSFGCQFSCSFCMISMVNRQSFADDYSTEKRNFMRSWSPGYLLKEFEKLADLGVKTLRISDEMWFLNSKNFEPLMKGIIDRGLKFDMWGYSRVSTIQEKYLDLFKQAGINWLAIGVEAAAKSVRLEATKGSFGNENVVNGINKIRSAGINTIANYIFGLPEDNLQTMQETLDLALSLNTETANFYSAAALPGSELYLQAKRNNWELPKTFDGYSFLGYETLPLPTNYVSAKDVLKFRDQAWSTYFSNPAYLSLVESKFGIQQRKNIEEMSKIKLKRRILE